MKFFIHKSLLVALCSTTIVACKPKLDAPAVAVGSANFSVFVSIGDGTPGGYADGALNYNAQLVAFPNLLAQQFALVITSGGGGSFIQPLVPQGVGYGYESGQLSSRLILKDSIFCDGSTQLIAAQAYPKGGESGLNTLIGGAGTFNNLAVQGTKGIYVNAQTAYWGSPSSTADTFWKKINNGSTTPSMLQRAMAMKPTFVSLYLGNTDIFRYAKSGGNQAPGDPSIDDQITPVAQFNDSLLTMLNTLTDGGKNGVKGVITNIVDLDAFPYFTYLRYNNLTLPDTTAVNLNYYYHVKNGNNNITFHEGANNAYVIYDSTTDNACKCRQIVEGEYLLLELIKDSLDLLKCQKLGSYRPISQGMVLDAREVFNITVAIAGYNIALQAAAAKYGFAYVDANSYMKNVIAGTQYQGVNLNTNYVSGNEFSLDGLNLSATGQALFANLCIQAINNLYGSAIPLLDITKYPSVGFP